MLGPYTYNEIIRKTIISFGTLFNNLFIKHQDESDVDKSLIKVPIAYGPIQKFLAQIEQKPDPRNKVALTLPRMAFEMTSLQYDASRKVSTVQTFKAHNGGPAKVYMPVPYNIGIQLSIMAKYNDDILQIVEQILPYFQPQFNLTIDLVPSIGEKRDIPISLDSIGMNDNYEGPYDTRRILIYTLNFTAKTYIFGPIADNTDQLIKKVQVDYYTNTDNIKNPSRQLRYIATPRALKDYNSDQSGLLAEDIDEKTTILSITPESNLQESTYININDESMYIREVSGTTIIVDRAVNSTSPSQHISGDPINIIDSSDDEQIQYGDDFGFNEERIDFGFDDL